MRTAQGLYEGIEINGETEGLITYMRTDSVMLSNDALADIRRQITEQFGPGYLPEQANFYKTKAKNAQEAHEAIRPTSAALVPNKIKASLTGDQFRLYELIWKRTLASQMTPAKMDTVAVEFDCGPNASFRANGSVVTFPGFLAAYEISQPESEKKQERRLPEMKEGDVIKLDAIRSEQHFTEPPPRYSKPAWLKQWKSMASADLQPTPASCLRWLGVTTRNWISGALNLPIRAAWLSVSWINISTNMSITNSRRVWKTHWMRYPGVKKTGFHYLTLSGSHSMNGLSRNWNQLTPGTPRGHEFWVPTPNRQTHFRASRPFWSACADRYQGG